MSTPADPPRLRRQRNLIGLAVLVAAIVAAHLALWSSDAVPVEAKRRLTLINASIWAVIVLPAFGVSLWLRAHRHRR